MARKSSHQFARRKREQARQERAAARTERRLARAASRRDRDDGDPDLSGIVAGPQPRDQASEQDVQRAVERALHPGRAMRDEARARHPARMAAARLFVGDLPSAASEQELQQFIEQTGVHVVEVTLVRDRTTGESRGFGFVQLADPDDADTVIAALDGATFQDHTLRVNPASQRSRR